MFSNNWSYNTIESPASPSRTTTLQKVSNLISFSTIININNCNGCNSSISSIYCISSSSSSSTKVASKASEPSAEHPMTVKLQSYDKDSLGLQVPCNADGHAGLLVFAELSRILYSRNHWICLLTAMMSNPQLQASEVILTDSVHCHCKVLWPYAIQWVWWLVFDAGLMGIYRLMSNQSGRFQFAGRVLMWVKD